MSEQQQQQQPQQQQQQQPAQQQQTNASSAAMPVAMTTNTAMPANAVGAAAAAAASIRSSLPQVQVLPQPMHSPTYLHQFPYNQQQFIMQNAAAMQAAMQMGFNPQQLNMNMAVMQGRSPVGGALTSPGIPPPSPNQLSTFQIPYSQPMGAVSVSSGAMTPVTNSNGSPTNGKPGTNGNKMTVNPTQAAAQAAAAQAVTMMGGKPAMPVQAATAPTPLVLGQLGTCVLSGQAISTSPGFVTQSKGMTYTMAHTAQPQLISTQAPLRFNQPQLVSSTGQIISSQPMLTNQAVFQAMAQAANLQQGIPLAAHQPLLSGGQTPAILAGQSLYIRTGSPMQAQQGMMAGVQAMPSNMKVAKTMEMPQNLQVKPSATGVPIARHTSTNSTGKALLPLKSSTTAKIQPTNLSVQGPKLNIPSVPKQKGRPKGTTRVAMAAQAAQAAANQAMVAAATQPKASTPTSQSKPGTPTGQAVCAPVQQSKSQSDSELETGRKTSLSSMENVKQNNPVALEKKRDSEKPKEVTREVETPDSEDTNQEVMDVAEKPPPTLLPVSHDVPALAEKQKAIVKPHILTHVIEGFVIQEGPEPFPVSTVQRSSLLTEFIPPKPGQRPDQVNTEEVGEMSIPVESPSPPGTSEPLGDNLLRCEFCGNIDVAAKFRRSKRFCSMSCAKRYNVGCSNRVGLFVGRPRKPGRPLGSGKGVGKKRKQLLKVRKGWRPGRGGRLSYNVSARLPSDMQPRDDDEQSSSHSGMDSSSSPASPIPPPDFEKFEMEFEEPLPKLSPTKWNVNEVYEFVKSLPGCAPYAEEFRSQEIDGQALMLLKEDHLMTAMNMKLGPALKICARINSLKDEII